MAGIHSWNVFRQAKNNFNYRQIGLTIGVLVMAFFVPLYSYFYLPSFDFLPYNVGTKIEAKNVVRLYDSGFNGVRSNWSGAAFSDADSVQCYDVGGAAALYFRFDFVNTSRKGQARL